MRMDDRTSPTVAASMLNGIQTNCIKQWITIHVHLHQCWLQVYGLLFWIVSALLSLWESPRSVGYHPYQDNGSRIINIAAELFPVHDPSAIIEPTAIYRHSAPIVAMPVQELDHSMPLTAAAEEKEEQDKRYECSHAVEKHGRAITRALKKHVQTIKQKHQSLSGIIKRSLLRPSRQQPSSTIQQHFFSLPGRKPSRRASFPPAHAPSPSPPPPLSPLSLLSKPFRQKAIRDIFKRKKHD
ncbi:hypothetical protein BX666DRAFT_311537 [Dichotomocladium elegans]|nr:hypothetical protein BX666DRAFT_311537 [Dichotomocladium elegans]